MGLSRNSFILNLITWLLFLSKFHGGQSIKQGQGFIDITVSKTGIDYVKDVMTSHALEALRDLHIPDMEGVVSVPMVGKAFAEMTNFSVIGLGVPSSSVSLGNSGVNIVAKHIDVNCSMNWHYECSSWIFPYWIDDKGTARVKVKRMEVGITFQLNEQNGSLNFVTVECGVFLQNLFINLDGGAAWIYQAFINAFEDRVRAAIETAITKNIMGSVTKLNTLLQNLPRVMKIDDHAAWNVTVMQAPEISPATVCVSLEGLIVDSTLSNALSLPTYKPEPILSWRDSSKMLGISLSEAVLYSAARVYANAGMLNWVVDKLPKQSVLNTASWKYVIPQLYNRYPNDDMKLNISVTSPPVISLTMDGIEVSVVSDLVIEVVDSNKTIPVLCVSMAVNGGGAISISGNNVIGNADVGNLSLQLKWSSIGKLHMRLIEENMPTGEEICKNTSVIDDIPGFSCEDFEDVEEENEYKEKASFNHQIGGFFVVSEKKEIDTCVVSDFQIEEILDMEINENWPPELHMGDQLLDEGSLHSPLHMEHKLHTESGLRTGSSRFDKETQGGEDQLHDEGSRHSSLHTEHKLHHESGLRSGSSGIDKETQGDDSYVWDDAMDGNFWDDAMDGIFLDDAKDANFCEDSSYVAALNVEGENDQPLKLSKTTWRGNMKSKDADFLDGTSYAAALDVIEESDQHCKVYKRTRTDKVQSMK